MKRITKIISMVLLLILLCGSIFAFACCNDKDRKYEISFRIVCHDPSDGAIDLGEWIMTPDITEIVINLEYRENGYLFYLAAYGFANRPDYNDKWFSSWDDNFILQAYIGGTKSVLQHPFTQRGNYMLIITTNNKYSNCPCYYRRACVFVTIN